MILTPKTTRICKSPQFLLATLDPVRLNGCDKRGSRVGGADAWSRRSLDKAGLQRQESSVVLFSSPVPRGPAGKEGKRERERERACWIKLAKLFWASAFLSFIPECCSHKLSVVQKRGWWYSRNAEPHGLTARENSGYCQCPLGCGTAHLWSNTDLTGLKGAEGGGRFDIKVLCLLYC